VSPHNPVRKNGVVLPLDLLQPVAHQAQEVGIGVLNHTVQIEGDDGLHTVYGLQKLGELGVHKHQLNNLY